MDKLLEKIEQRISIYENDLAKFSQNKTSFNIKYARQIESTSTALITLRWVRNLIKEG